MDPTPRPSSWSAQLAHRCQFLPTTRFQPQDQHVLHHPALLARHYAGNPESKTLFPEQRDSTVARTHDTDQFLLRKVDNVPPRGIEVAQRMQSGDKLVRSSQPVHGYFAHTRHDPHARHHVWAVRDFHANFADRRAHW